MHIDEQISMTHMESGGELFLLSVCSSVEKEKINKGTMWGRKALQCPVLLEK